MRVLPECGPPALFKSSPVWSYLLRSGVGLVDHAGSYPRPEWPQDDAEYRALSSHLRTARRSRRRAREPFGTTLGGKNVLTQSSVEKHLQQALDQGVSLATTRDNSNRSSTPAVDMSSQGVLSHESARIIKLRHYVFGGQRGPSAEKIATDGLNLLSSTLASETTAAPLGEIQADQIS